MIASMDDHRYRQGLGLDVMVYDTVAALGTSKPKPALFDPAIRTLWRGIRSIAYEWRCRWRVRTRQPARFELLIIIAGPATVPRLPPGWVPET
jgi:hypothetical protein